MNYNEHFQGGETPRNRFEELLHEHGASSLFLVGTILLIGGGVITALSMGVFGVATLLTLILPAIALIMTYSICKNKKPMQSMTTPLTLVKVDVILSLVYLGLAFIGGLAIIGVVGYVIDSIMFVPDMDLIVGVMAVAFVITYAIILVPLIIFYYVPLLRILADIRAGALTGHATWGRIRGVLPFSVMIYILAGLTLLAVFSNLGSMAAMQSIANELYMLELIGLDWMFFMFDPTFIILSSLGGIAQGLGMILLVVVLGKFNKAVMLG